MTEKWIVSEEWQEARVSCVAEDAGTGRSSLRNGEDGAAGAVSARGRRCHLGSRRDARARSPRLAGCLSGRVTYRQL
ncbi:hypothetical protein AV530_009161 [Patagioenas fasciata monilis]|uniref:Uncharacterized protein n=1 Tax=Patagioenas fasciata monilis TaxID=372326 RepID=A0A1V4IWM0_PATFA|nr:hypothetical protein AV530_009161 [Patagioenas fasciata monilis]